MINNIKKKDSRRILYFCYIFGNHWDSKRPPYLICRVLTRSGYRGTFQTQGIFSKCLHFREVGVFITKNKIFV